ncbi:hypothetical protein J6590_023163 [Homalodisca vitripennis]|nr:hypothetical protein J6590_023163 [Homalodisca vitripennis]
MEIVKIHTKIALPRKNTTLFISLVKTNSAVLNSRTNWQPPLLPSHDDLLPPFMLATRIGLTIAIASVYLPPLPTRRRSVHQRLSDSSRPLSSPCVAPLTNPPAHLLSRKMHR